MNLPLKNEKYFRIPMHHQHKTSTSWNISCNCAKDTVTNFEIRLPTLHTSLMYVAQRKCHFHPYTHVTFTAPTSIHQVLQLPLLTSLLSISKHRFRRTFWDYWATEVKLVPITKREPLRFLKYLISNVKYPFIV